MATRIKDFFDEPQMRYLLKTRRLSVGKLARLGLLIAWNKLLKTAYFGVEKWGNGNPWVNYIMFNYNFCLVNRMRRDLPLSVDVSYLGSSSFRKLELKEEKNLDKGKAEYICLATTNAQYSRDLFHYPFPDLEDVFAIHRFHWLLDMISERPTIKSISIGYEAIKYWIDTFGVISAGTGFDSYSISERLVNWLYFFILTKEYSELDSVLWNNASESVATQLKMLIQHLEYHWKFTNNHVLNNGRCLYVCGSLLNIGNAKEIGREILLDETDELVKKGVLQEGSSHYQMLLTRSFIEIAACAKYTNDLPFYRWLKTRVSKMLRVCSLLQSKHEGDEYPLFGDISPDARPQWFMGYPFSGHNTRLSPWKRLFPVKIPNELVGIGPISLELNKAGDNWVRIGSGGFELWISLRGSDRATHGHHDNGSIVAFYEGTPLIVDIGRFSYKESDNNSFQCSQEGHNVPMIEGVRLEADSKSSSQQKLLRSKFNILRIRSDYIEFRLGSFDGEIEIVRKISVDESRIIIDDRIEKFFDKAKILRYENNWFLSGKCQFNDGHTDTLFLQERSMELKVNCSHATEAQYTLGTDTRAVRYGELIPVSLLKVYSLLDLGKSVSVVLRKA